MAGRWKWDGGNRAADDLSGEAADSLAASGALAGGTSSNETAMTAEGSDPAQPLEDGDAAPHVGAGQRNYRHIVRG